MKHNLCGYYIGVRPAKLLIWCALASCVCSAPSGAEEQKDAKAASVPAGAVAVVEVEETVGTAVILWQKLLSGAITPEAAWQAGQLNANDIVEILNMASSSEHEKLVRSMIALLDRHVPEKIADPTRQKPRAQNLIVEYFSSIKDPRTVTYYEAMLAPIKQPQPEGAMPVFKLSDYYAKIGDLKKAAETRLRMKDYTTHPAYLANSEVEAARFYRKIGEEEKAKTLYEGASRHGYGWATGMLLIDQARHLMSQGKHEQARRITETPVTGQYATDAEPTKRMLLGYSYYLTGDLAAAHQHTAASIAQYRAIEKPLQGEGLENIFASAANRLRIIEGWIKEPIQVQPREIHLQLNPNQTEAVVRRVQVHTFHPMPLEVSVQPTATTGITVRLVESDGWKDKQTDDGEKIREVIIEISPAEAILQAKSMVTQIVLSSQTHPQSSARVAVKISR